MSSNPSRGDLAGPEYGSVADIAEYGGCSVATVRRRISDGTLPAYRLGPRLLRIRYSDFDKFMRRLPTAKRGAAA